MRDLNPENLVRDLRIVIEDADQLLRATADNAGDKVARAHARAERSLQTMRKHVLDAEHDIADRARIVVRTTDRYVHRHPWNVIAAAAGVAFLLGYLTVRLEPGR